MRLRLILLTLLALTLTTSFAASTACREVPCEIDSGSYFLDIPNSWDGSSPLPAILFFHGHNSSGASTMRSQGIRQSFLNRGYLVIAPNGSILPGRTRRAWPARPNRQYRDDIAFVNAVIADISQRLPLDLKRTLVGGFSAGGSMAWMMGCYEGKRFGGFVSLSGALRRPVPSSDHCPGGPFRMLHLHGFADTQVPLEGRAIRDWHQGDVFESLALARNTNQCASKPSLITIDDGYRCREWSSCQSGKDIKLCLHDGGHGLPKGWTDMARRWFEQDQSVVLQQRNTNR